MTTGATTQYLKWSLYKSGTTMSEIIGTLKLMLLEGEYTAQTLPAYVPYGCIQIKKCNKNLLDYNWLLHSISESLTVSVIENGIRLTNTNGYAVSTQGNDLKLKPNTKYTLSCKSVWGISAENQNWGWQIKDLDNNVVIVSTNLKTDFVSFETGTGTNYRIWYYIGYPNTNAGTVDLTEIQLVEGEYTAQTMPDYIPHAEKTYNFPLSEGQVLYEDTATEVNGIHNLNTKEVYDGTSTALSSYIGSTTDTYIFQIATSNLANITRTGKGKCNILKKINYSYSANEESYYLTNNNLVFKINKTTIDSQTGSTTLDKIKSFLNSTPLEIYGARTTEEIVPYTTEQQNVIDEIISDGTYKEVTHYTAEASLNPNMEIGYYKDLEIWVNNLINS